MTRWQADERTQGMMRLFRLLPDARMSDAAWERTRRQVMRHVRRLRRRQRIAAAWQSMTAEAQNVWSCVFVAALLVWLIVMGR